MSAADGLEDRRADLPIETDEQFLATVLSGDVIEADAQLWELFERFLGVDPVTAWVLAEVTHTPEVDEGGAYTGRLKSTAVWKRDPKVMTPTKAVVFAELPDEDVGQPGAE